MNVDEEQWLRERMSALRTPLASSDAFTQRALAVLTAMLQASEEPHTTRLREALDYLRYAKEHNAFAHRILHEGAYMQYDPSVHMQMASVYQAVEHAVHTHSLVNPHQTIRVEGQTARTETEFDPMRLHQALIHLFTNATQHAKKGTEVTVTVQRTGASIHVSVQNWGPPLSSDEHTRVWERGYRSQEARRLRPEGAGWGLYLVKENILDQGGDVGVESEYTRGTIFWLELPVVIQKRM